MESHPSRDLQGHVIWIHLDEKVAFSDQESHLAAHRWRTSSYFCCSSVYLQDLPLCCCHSKAIVLHLIGSHLLTSVSWTSGLPPMHLAIDRATLDCRRGHLPPSALSVCLSSWAKEMASSGSIGGSSGCSCGLGCSSSLEDPWSSSCSPSDPFPLFYSFKQCACHRVRASGSSSAAFAGSDLRPKTVPPLCLPIRPRSPLSS